MKILSIGNFGHGWDGSQCDEEHIAKALEELGHEVTRVQRDEVSMHSGTNDYDFALIQQWGDYSDDLVTRLRMFTDKVVFAAFDYQEWGQPWCERLIEQVDLYLSKRIADSKYPNWQYWSQDFAPWFMNRHNEKPERDIDVLFTGSYLPWATDRNETLKAVDEQFNLVIHSVTPDAWVDQGFKNVFGPVMDKDYTGLIARAKVNLSIDHTIEAGYWSDRNAQIMACGGFVLSRYIPLMETVFRDKVEYFYSVDDCLAKIAYFLGSEAERKVKGSLGYSFAQENLMVKHRVRDLLTIVENYLWKK